MSPVATPAAGQKQKSIACFFSKSATKTPNDATVVPPKEKAITPLDKVATTTVLDNKAAPAPARRQAKKPAAKKPASKKRAAPKEKPVLCIIDGEDIDTSVMQPEESYSVLSTPPSVYTRDTQGETSDAVDIIAASCRPESEEVDASKNTPESAAECSELVTPSHTMEAAQTEEHIEEQVTATQISAEQPPNDETATPSEKVELQDVETSANDSEVLVSQQAAAAEDSPVDSTNAAPPAKKPRRRAASAKKQAADAAAVIDVDSESADVTEKRADAYKPNQRSAKPVPVAPPLSASAQARVQLITEKMDAALESLSSESKDEVILQHLDSSISTACEILATADNSLKEVALRRVVEAVLHRYATAPLSQILSIITDRVTVSDNLTPLLEPLRLSEVVKSLASRTAHGVRGKTALVFEDVSPLGLWRWEMHSSSSSAVTSDSPAAALPDPPKTPSEVEESIREIKAAYGRVGRVVKNYQRLIDEITKQDGHQTTTGSAPSPEDATKLDQLEEKAVKAWGDMERAKDKRLALLKKRESDAIEKRRKEQEKLEKQQQKEREQEEKKRAIAEAAAQAAQKKEPAAASAKAASNAAVEKQRNLMMQFIKTAAPAPASTIKAAADSFSQSSTQATNASTRATFDIQEFERNLETPMSSSQLMQQYRLRYADRTVTPRGKRRQKKSLMVTVTVNQNEFAGGGFGGSGGYCCEVKEVSVDSRKKLLSFAEDYRPAYFKKSHLVTGRRPFGMDRRVLNYDYDSEAEWEEEDPNGEDLAESDGCSEDDTAESDDGFIRPDDEYDSGIDGDEEEGVRISVRAASMANMREILGVRFLGAEMGTTAASAHDSMSARLMQYKAVVYSHMTTPLRLPLLTTDVAANTVDSEVAVDGSGAAPSCTISGSSAPTSCLTDEMMRELVRHVHGSTMGMDKLVESFHEKCIGAGLAAKVNKSEVRRRILEIASKRRGGEGTSNVSVDEIDKEGQGSAETTYGRARWVVHAGAAEKYAPDEVCAEIKFTPQKSGKKKRKSVTDNSSNTKRNKSDKAKIPSIVLDVSDVVEDPNPPQEVEHTDTATVDQSAPLPKAQKTLHSFLQSTPATTSSPPDARTGVVVIADDDSRHVWGWREEKDCS